MEEIRQIAAAYYESGSEEERILFISFFRSIDEDGDDLVSFSEFTEFMRHEGHENMCTRQFFNQLDEDSSGGLDFNEMITLYYIIKSGRPICGRCKVFITGTYFTCMTCFNYPKSSFTVCIDCYKEGGNFKKEHGEEQFVDNFSLLEFKRKSAAAANKSAAAANKTAAAANKSAAAANKGNENQRASWSSQAVLPNSNTQMIVPPPTTRKWVTALVALNAGLQIASTLANCTIM